MASLEESLGFLSRASLMSSLLPPISRKSRGPLNPWETLISFTLLFFLLLFSCRLWSGITETSNKKSETETISIYFIIFFVHFETTVQKPATNKKEKKKTRKKKTKKKKKRMRRNVQLKQEGERKRKRKKKENRKKKETEKKKERKKKKREKK